MSCSTARSTAGGACRSASPRSTRRGEPSRTRSSGAEALELVSSGALPPRAVPNAWFSSHGVDTSDEWIRQRTGILSRRVLAPGGSLRSLALEACAAALDHAPPLPHKSLLHYADAAAGAPEQSLRCSSVHSDRHAR